MRDFIVMMLVNSAALVIIAKIFHGITVKGWRALLLSALVIGVINASIKPIILLLTLPINVFTLGLLTLFINGLLLYAVSILIKGFSIKSYWDAFFGALIFGIISVLLSWIIG